MSKRKFVWLVEIEIDETWVADGFEITAERAGEWVEKDIGYASPDEISVRIKKAPKSSDIRAVQGYKIS